MKTFTLLLLAALATGAAAREISFDPPAGTIDPEVYPAGISSFEILSGDPLQINRDATGFITLSKHGATVCAIPASNVPDLYTFTEFNKTEKGNLHVTFHSNQNTSPYKYLGKYTVTVPAGVFTYSSTGLSNEEFSVDYVITTPEFSVWPEPDRKHTSVAEVKMSFIGVESVTYNSALSETDLAAFVFSFSPSDGGESTEIPVTAKDFKIEDTTVTFTTPALPGAAGRLSLSIPANAFKMTDDEEIDAANGEITVNYDIVESIAPTPDYTVTPAPGEYEKFTSTYYESIGKYAFFRIDMPEDMTLLSYPSMQHPVLLPVLDGVADSSNPFQSFSVQNVAADNAVYVYDGSYSSASQDFAYKTEGNIIPPAGEYILQIPANTFTLQDGSRNEAFSFSYKVTQPESDDRYTVTPATDKKAELPVEHIRIYFPLAGSSAWTTGEYAIISNGIVKYALPANTADLDCGGSSVTIEIPGGGITDPGIYTVTIPQRALYIDGVPSGLVFKIYAGVDAPGSLSVEEISGAGDEDSPVYTISGTRVPDGRKLTPGIYVRRGEKIIVR